MRSFESIWSEIQAIATFSMLNQKPILTLQDETKNSITEVTDDYIKRDSAGKKTGIASKIRKGELKRIYDALAKNKKVKAKDIGTLYFSYSLFAKLKEVSYTLNPLTLYWTDQEEPQYYLVGSKYGPEASISMLDEMISEKVVSVGFYHSPLYDYYLKSEEEIKEYLVKKNQKEKSYTVLKKFLQLKPGDIVAIKKSGTPKGSTPSLIIGAYAMVVERDKKVYTYSDKLRHCINVEFLDTHFYTDFAIGGFNRTLHKIDDITIRNILFKGYLKDDSTRILNNVRKRRRTASTTKDLSLQVRQGSQPYVANSNHNKIQILFTEQLKEIYGEEKVKMEQDWVDIILNLEDSLVFYEIKPYHLAEDCIREALGQLIIYSFFSSDDRVKKLVVVGPSAPTEEEKLLIKFIQKNLIINIEYEHFIVN